MAGSKKTTKAKDLAPRKSGAVKGGGKRLNDNVTLVRGAKPAVKNDHRSTLILEDTMAGSKKTTKTKDLAPKKSGAVKGGKVREKR